MYNPEGNYDAYSMATFCKKLLEHIGINPKRLRLEWVSAGEGIRFAHIMNEFSREIEALGPLGSSEGIDRDELKSRLEQMARLIPYFKLAKMKNWPCTITMRRPMQMFTIKNRGLIREAPTYYIDRESARPA
jgi:hypothetical protein